MHSIEDINKVIEDLKFELKDPQEKRRIYKRQMDDAESDIIHIKLKIERYLEDLRVLKEQKITDYDCDYDD